MKPALVTIAEFAQMCRTTVRTIRFYDQAGLLKPLKVDQWNKYRYYSPFQTRDFFRIKLLQNFEVPLENIPKILRQKNASQFLEEKTADVEAEIKEKQKELKFLKEIRRFLFETDELTQAVKIESVGPFNLFGTYIPNEAYHTITPHMQQVQDKADKLRIQHLNKQLIFYLEREKYNPKNTKIEVTVAIKDKVPKIKLPDGYFFKKFPKIKAYITAYTGPFEFITLIYEKLHQLKITERLPVKFAPFDIHLNGFDPRLSPFERVTKICFPISNANDKSQASTKFMLR